MSPADALASSVETETDAGTHGETSRPGTPAQTDTRSQSRNTSQEDLYTQHNEPSYFQGDNTKCLAYDQRRRQRQQQQRQQQPWTWKTLLLIEDEADEVDLGAYNCTAITLHEEDIASPAALRYKVYARLWRLSVQVGRPYRAQDLGEELDPGLDISIGWDLSAGGDDDGHGSGNGGVGGTWSLNHRTPLALSTGPLAAEGEEGEEEQGEEEEAEAEGEGEGAERETAAWLREEEGREEEAAAWLRENMELAASGLHGRAVLLARIVPRVDPTFDMEEAYRTGEYV
ncbi:hypothetical protein SLS53_001825 [Cytospora paraplurivora]|uniref:Uncharacterized protein n=1 Tax=Cytospora paraplurivora TaxID=2898453 RepID=A0AAN9UEF6_9PEZI